MRLSEKHNETLAATVIVFSALVAAAGDTTNADEVLRRVDASMTAVNNQILEYECKTEQAGQDPRAIAFRVHLKGDTFRRVDFLAPGDVKGMRILIRAVDKMYVYLPAFKKVRRVASHVNDQGFMGTAFSHDDMSLVTYGASFGAKLLEQSTRHWKVEATRRAGIDIPYAKLVIEIRRDLSQPVQIEYYNDRGVLVKTETRLEFSCQGDVCSPRKIIMVDHTRNDLRSTLIRRRWQPNAGLDDTFFTVRALQKP